MIDFDEVIRIEFFVRGWTGPSSRMLYVHEEGGKPVISYFHTIGITGCSADDEETMAKLGSFEKWEMEEGAAKRLIEGIDEAGIMGWEPVYDNPNVLDGFQWGLSVKLRGSDALGITRTFESRGTNAYPDSWDILLRAVCSIDPFDISDWGIESA